MADYLLAKNGCSDWHIIMAHPVHETVKLAAHELQKFLMQMSGAALPTQTELQPKAEKEILVGRSSRLAEYGIEIDWEGLGEEGFVMKTGDNWLLLAGNTPRGTLYAVYAFLEEIMGIRWLASDCTVIPTPAEVVFPELDRVEIPAFESREAYWSDAFDGDYAVRNRMNSNKADISIRQGGRMKFYNFHHSFDELVNYRDYFDTHPEYFAEVDGKRLNGPRTQLCLTNPEVLKLAIAKVRQWIKENPDCRVFSVAQNDWANYCTCPKCRAIDEAEGSPAATMLLFVNALAEEIEKDYPDVLIHTFAYQYTRKAPKTIRPRHNVIVRLCSIECCFSHPLDGKPLAPIHPEAMERKVRQNRAQCACAGEHAFLDDLREWGQITKHLYVWDYVTQFGEYLMPMPNFDVLQRNLQLFRSIGVAGILEQGNFCQGGGGHLAELEAYLQAKLMWNPDCDVEAHMNDFLRGYYGQAAAPIVREYIELWQEAARPWHVSIFASPDAAYVSTETIEKSVRLIGEAMWRTKDPVQHKRLNKLMLSMTYLSLCHMPEGTPGRNALIDRFGWELREAGITEIHERWTLEESIEQLKLHAKRKDQTRTIINDYKM